MNKRIFLSPPHMTGDELKLITEAFQTNWIAPAGPQLDQFEKDLSAYSGVPYCAALSSGTAAIHLALMILGVKAGDEVICSSFTFAGSCNPIVYVNATPVFVDSDYSSWNMDPNYLRAAILDRIKKGKKPKAIIVVHLYGMSARIKEIMQIANEFEIPVVEDAAEALGSSFDNKKLGSFGDIGIFSFNGNKIITTSGGGAMVSRNPVWIKQAKFLSQQARDPAPHYQHSSIGYNYRLSNVCAAIGIGQLKVIDERVHSRRKNFFFYQKHLSKIKGISFQPEPPETFSNRWLTCITIEPGLNLAPEDIRLTLEECNIESRPLWKPMHSQPVYKDAPYYGDGESDTLFARGLCLPSGSQLDPEELNRVVEIVENVINGKN
jgi:dTDP-4-amino-4,6-dideoxygalactose transaminase